MKVAERVSEVSSAGPERRKRALLVLAVTSLLLVPAAISWACGPNRAIQTDRISYTPGQTVQVTGANFEAGASVDIKLNGSTVTSTTVSGTGSLFASFPAPTAPGTYNLRTDGVDQNGQALAGTGNTVTFTVAPAPSGSPGGGSGGGSGSGSSSGTTSPGTGSASPAPGATSGGGERGRPGDNNRSVSGGERVGSAPANRGINTTEGQITTDGTTAFAGSVTRATRSEVAERATGRGAPNAASARPSERSAGADLWSGLASGKNPSLLPADGAGAPESGTGSGLALALALLGAGGLALAGLGVAEARRRSRATVR